MNRHAINPHIVSRLAKFRDPVARDRAWAKHYASRGLRAPVTRDVRSMPNPFRIANYLLRAAKHNAAVLVSGSLVKC